MQRGLLAECSVLSLPIWSPPSVADFCFSAVTVWAWCHRKHGRGCSLFGTMPRRRLDIWLWSAPFPGALLSNFLALWGTSRLLHWCHLLQVSPESCGFPFWSAGTGAAPEEVWASLPAFSAPARALTRGWVPASSSPATALPPGILGSEFFSLYLYLEQDLIPPAQGLSASKLNRGFNSPLTHFWSELSMTTRRCSNLYHLQTSWPRPTCSLRRLPSRSQGGIIQHLLLIFK